MQKAKTPKVRKRWGQDAQFIQDKGRRYLGAHKGLIDGIDENDPRYIAAEKAWKKQGIEATLIARLLWEKKVAGFEASASKKEAERTAEADAKRKAVKTAGTDAVKVMQALVGDVAVREASGYVNRVEPGGLKKALRNSIPVVAVREGVVVVSVPETHAATFAKRYGFQRGALEWISGSRHCWAFSDLGYVTLGLQAGSIAGDKLEIASCRFGSSMQLIFAPIDSLRWIVKPSQVELTADGLLPMTPAPFTRLVDALGGVAPVAIDQAVLG